MRSKRVVCDFILQGTCLQSADSFRIFDLGGEGVWLRVWPVDWQDVSVRFFAVMVRLSLLWVPLARIFKSIAGNKTKD